MTRAGVPQVTRRALLDAVRDVYLERGYDGTSIHMIAQRAGLTTGAVYSNFKNKDDLLTTLFEEQADQVVANLTERFQNADTVASRIETLLEWYGNRSAREPLGARLTFDLLRRSYDNPDVRERLAQVYNRSRTLAAQALQQELMTQGITPPLPPETLAALIIALVDGIVMQQLIYNGNGILQDLRSALELFELVPTQKESDSNSQ